jgi:uncharacterized protein (DUF2336 family)
MEVAIAERIDRFANVLASAVYAQSVRELAPVLTEVEELLSKACILERLVFTRHVLNTPGVPRDLIDRLMADNFLVARMLAQAGYGLDDERTIRLLSTRDEAFQLDIASHDGLSERITDYLIEIGGPEVAYRLARNKRAKLSGYAMAKLVEQASHDHRLLQALSNRLDQAALLDPPDPRVAAPDSVVAATAQSRDKGWRSTRRAKIISHR